MPGAHQLLFGPAFAAGFAVLAAWTASGLSTAGAEWWPHAPFGTPPSFSRDYPLPLYVTQRFIPLQELVDRENTLEARRRSVPEARAETFTELQKIAPRGAIGPSQSALAYGPAAGLPRLEEPHRSQRPRKAKVQNPKPRPVHVSEHANRHPAAPSSKPTNILPPAARGQ